MITKNSQGGWGVEIRGEMAFDTFNTLCQISAYLNKTNPQKPTAAEIKKVPSQLLSEIKDLL